MIIEIDKKDDNDVKVGSVKINVLDILIQKYNSDNYILVIIKYCKKEHWLITLYDKASGENTVVRLFEWLHNPKYKTLNSFLDTLAIAESDLCDYIEAYYDPVNKSEARNMGADSELALGYTILTEIAVNMVNDGPDYYLDRPVGKEVMDIVDKKIRERVV